MRCLRVQLTGGKPGKQRWEDGSAEGKDEEESEGPPEHVGANLANYYLAELDSFSTRLKSARKEGDVTFTKRGTFQGGGGCDRSVAGGLRPPNRSHETSPSTHFH